jgi:hypothetical protein
MCRAGSDQPQVRFVDQCRCLERLPRLLASKFLCGQLPQLVIDQGQELAGSDWVAVFDR